MDAVKDFLSDHHIIAGIYPVADFAAGGVNSDIVSLKNYRRATFLVYTGAVEDADISNLVTVEACDDTTPTNSTAMAFHRRYCLSSTTVDTWGALTAATSSGYNFANQSDAGVANVMWLVEVTADEVEAAAAGYEYVRLCIAETANKTITGGCICILSDPRYPGAVPQTAIT